MPWVVLIFCFWFSWSFVLRDSITINLTSQSVKVHSLNIRNLTLNVELLTGKILPMTYYDDWIEVILH